MTWTWGTSLHIPSYDHLQAEIRRDRANWCRVVIQDFDFILDPSVLQMIGHHMIKAWRTYFNVHAGNYTMQEFYLVWESTPAVKQQRGANVGLRPRHPRQEQNPVSFVTGDGSNHQRIRHNTREYNTKYSSYQLQTHTWTTAHRNRAGYASTLSPYFLCAAGKGATR